MGPGTNVPSKLRARPQPRSGCRTPAHEFRLLPTFIGLLCTQFDLAKIKLKYKLQYFFLFWVAYEYNVCCEIFSQIAVPPALPKPTQLLLRRQHGLLTSICGLDGMFPVSYGPNAR
jgi:hypothetical protein